MLLIDKHKLEQKCINFGYLSTQFWLKGNDKMEERIAVLTFYRRHLFYISIMFWSSKACRWLWHVKVVWGWGEGQGCLVVVWRGQHVCYIKCIMYWNYCSFHYLYHSIQLSGALLVFICSQDHNVTAVIKRHSSWEPANCTTNWGVIWLEPAGLVMVLVVYRCIKHKYFFI